MKRRKGKGRAEPITLDIKLRYIGPARPTRQQVVRALEHMLATGGDVPDQWQFAAIDWRRPTKGTEGYRSGSVGNFAQFAPIIERQLASLKIAFGRKAEP